MSKHAAFWDKAAKKYAADPIADMAGYEHTRDRIRALLTPEHAVLELGCGTGSTAFELADCVASYRATDFSSAMIDIAKSKQDANTPKHLSFAVQDAETLGQDQYDVILAMNLLHLLPSLEDVLDDVFAALPRGGLFIAKTALLKDGAWFIPWIIPVMRAIGKAPYVRSLRQTELTQMITKAGFVLDETSLQDGMAPRLFTVARKP